MEYPNIKKQDKKIVGKSTRPFDNFARTKLYFLFLVSGRCTSMRGQKLPWLPADIRRYIAKMIGCDHGCGPKNSIGLCCFHGDKRPIEKYYPKYIDGLGFLMTAIRSEYYCADCKNMKNTVKRRPKIRIS